MPDTFLRYRFDRADEIRKHFHASGERAYFFYPHAVPAPEEARVVLEVTFDNSDQSCTLQGTAVGSTANPRGVWLEFPCATFRARRRSRTWAAFSI